ncbi:hypothetical protein [Neptuniibacter marinus]|uniref:hypothetical protein n=1 Tax=Neptuniibacter marinus TaxID=1806670 RepID=UPI000829A684|nr:hypothetical protein [Neptuniibacter marinus]
MLIQIVDPIFKCAVDEEVFISRLHGMSTYQSVFRRNDTYQLRLAGPLDKTENDELQEICDIWGADFNLVEEGE